MSVDHDIVMSSNCYVFMLLLLLLLSLLLISIAIVGILVV